jgi:hypothetical protein
LIQVKHEPGANVEVLPLTMVNMLQKMNLETRGEMLMLFWKTHLSMEVGTWTLGSCHWVIPL